MRNNKKTVLVINGPNLNLLGTREPHLYGHETLQDVETAGLKQAQDLNANVEFFQRYLQSKMIGILKRYSIFTGQLTDIDIATGKAQS